MVVCDTEFDAADDDPPATAYPTTVYAVDALNPVMSAGVVVTPVLVTVVPDVGVATNVYDVAPDTVVNATLNRVIIADPDSDMVGGVSVSVVADTEFESADVVEPLMDRIVMGVYVVPAARPVTVVGVDVTPDFTAVPL
jgi:hypothetical protein